MRSLVVFMIFFPCVLIAQVNLPANQIEVLKIKADDFAGRDQYGSYYFIANNVFIKRTGSETLEYNNLAKGRIARADVTNPLLIVLFYADFNTVVLLDNQLNAIREIEFSNLARPILVGGAGLAEQNKLWIYDTLSMQILLYDYTNNLFRTISTPLPNGIEYYETSLTGFKWIDHTGQIFSCDVYGEVKTRGKIAGFDDVRFATEQSIFFIDGGKLYFADLTKKDVMAIPDVGNSVRKFHYIDQILYIFTSKGITKYQIKIP